MGIPVLKALWSAGATLLVALLALTSVSKAQGRLGGEFVINTYTTSGQTRPSVAVDGDGDFVVVWVSHLGQDGDGSGVFGQWFTSEGRPLGGEFQVNTYTTSSQTSPTVAMEPDGNFVVAWQSNGQDGSYYGIRGQRFLPQGLGAGLEFAVNTYTTNTQSGASAAMDADGDFVIVWGSAGQDGSFFGVRGRRFTSAGSASSTFQVNSYTTLDQHTASVSMDADGNFVAVWQSEADGSGSSISGQRFASNGAPVGTEFQVNTYTTSHQVLPSVAMNAAGRFVVVWDSVGQDGHSDGVFGQRFAANGARLGGEFPVNSYTTFAQSFPVVALDDDGNFVVVWRSSLQDGDDDGIYGQRFTADGSRLGTEFRVNRYTPSDQDHPAVAMDAFGRFIVVWDSVGQDGSGTAVVGQRFRFGEFDLFIGDAREEGRPPPTVDRGRATR